MLTPILRGEAYRLLAAADGQEAVACFLKPVDVGQLLELVRSRVPLSHASARGEWEDEEYRSR